MVPGGAHTPKRKPLPDVGSLAAVLEMLVVLLLLLLFFELHNRPRAASMPIMVGMMVCAMAVMCATEVHCVLLDSR